MKNLIAIVGPAGSGKSQVISLLIQTLASPTITINESTYRDDKSTSKFLKPDFVKLMQDLVTLKSNHTIPESLILVEGIFLLSHPELTALFDFILYVDAPKDLCLQRLVFRNKADLNKPGEVTLEESTMQRSVYSTYIKPYKKNAHFVIDNSDTREILSQTIQYLTQNNIFKNPLKKSKLNLLSLTKSQGTLFIISGPSGVGKTTLIRSITKTSNIKRVITYTTRPKRIGEISDALFSNQEPDYHFIDKDTFEEMSKKQQFMLEITIHGHSYGATKESFLEPLAQGQNLIVDLDQAHLNVLHAHIAKIITIFIAPAWEGQLESQLKARAESNTTKRIASGIALMDSHPEFIYDYLIVNQSLNLNDALVKLKNIILVEGLKFKRDCSETKPTSVSP